MLVPQTIAAQGLHTERTTCTGHWLHFGHGLQLSASVGTPCSASKPGAHHGLPRCKSAALSQALLIASRDPGLQPLSAAWQARALQRCKQHPGTSCHSTASRHHSTVSSVQQELQVRQHIAGECGRPRHTWLTVHLKAQLWLCRQGERGTMTRTQIGEADVAHCAEKTATPRRPALASPAKLATYWGAASWVN